ncbi:ABC-three component system middle component 2 [Chitinilyticum aquatile]|uniref:ABC-three component system middle component 2 n=1 Tax=Chitinilyticum aquatile TaxID=362520 RepID=UPI00048D0ED6|nr:ABC-three component system middle component 2 [Chitinilyticum aquatile]
MSEVFNTSFELGIRMVYLLMALYPRKVDLQRLVYFDYAAIYSADLNGPESLHTPVPLRGGEYASRRQVIEEGLYLMAQRSFVEVEAGPNGISFQLGENGPTLVSLIGNEYSRELYKRCQWVTSVLGDKDDKALEALFGVRGALWGAELVSSEFTEESE